MSVEISDRARGVQAVLAEFDSVEAQQAKIGEQMAILLFEQVKLAEKSRVLKQTLAKLLNEPA